MPTCCNISSITVFLSTSRVRLLNLGFRLKLESCLIDVLPLCEQNMISSFITTEGIFSKICMQSTHVSVSSSGSSTILFWLLNRASIAHRLLPLSWGSLPKQATRPASWPK